MKETKIYCDMCKERAEYIKENGEYIGAGHIELPLPEKKPCEPIRAEYLEPTIRPYVRDGVLKMDLCTPCMCRLLGWIGGNTRTEKQEPEKETAPTKGSTCAQCGGRSPPLFVLNGVTYCSRCWGR